MASIGSGARLLFVRVLGLRTWQVVLVASVLRLGWLALCPNEPVSDQGTYYIAASELAAGHGYNEVDGSPANLWPVGYPALLAAAYWLFGESYTVGYVLNVVLGLLIVLGTLAFARLLFDRQVAIVAALLVAVHPTLVMHTTMLASETPFCAGLLWLSALLLRMARGEGSLRWSVPVAGTLLGALCYVRPTGQVFFAILPLWGVWLRRLRPRVLVFASTGVALVALLVLLPWGLRNKALFGEMSLTSNNAGENLWMGNNPVTNGEAMEVPQDVRELPLVEREAVLRARAVSFIVEHPARYALLCVMRTVYTLRSDTIAASWNAIGIMHRFGEQAIVVFAIVCTAFHWLLLALVSYALLTRQRWTREDGALGTLFVLLSAPFVFIVGGNRYLVPIIPLFCIVAASGLCSRSAELVAPRHA